MRLDHNRKAMNTDTVYHKTKPQTNGNIMSNFCKTVCNL